MRYSIFSLALLALASCTAIAAPTPDQSGTQDFDNQGTSDAVMPEGLPPIADAPGDEPIWLTKHNEYRARHGAPKLKIDPVLQQFAQSYVRKCLGMVHSGKYSENLAGGGPPNTDYNKVLGQSVDMWYNEIKDYNFNNPGFSMKTGHFTQVVWNAATKIGCGYHNCLDGQGPFTGWLVSCNYDQGNMPGEFPWNVKPVRQ